MLPNPSRALWVYHQGVDLRKSYRSLAALVKTELSHDPQSGEAFVFVNRRKTLAKVLMPFSSGTLIDPAVSYGSREADLAFSEMFGQLPESFYAA